MGNASGAAGCCAGTGEAAVEVLVMVPGHYVGTMAGSTATIRIHSNCTATIPQTFQPMYFEPCNSTIDFEAQAIGERIRQHRRQQRAASIAQVHELRALPSPRPVNHRIPGRDIRRLIPRRI